MYDYGVCVEPSLEIVRKINQIKYNAELLLSLPTQEKLNSG